MKRAVLLFALGFSPILYAQEARNALTTAFDIGVHSYAIGSGNFDGGHHLSVAGKIEYARSVLPNLELTFAAGGHMFRVESSSGPSYNTILSAFSVGGRQFMGSRSKETWTPFIEAALAEGSLHLLGGGRTSLLRGYQLGAGVSKSTGDQKEFRILLNHDRFIGGNPGSGDRVFGVGVQMAFAQRF